MTRARRRRWNRRRLMIREWWERLLERLKEALA